MPQLFQINEQDLAELERILPQLYDRWMLNPELDNWTRMKVRKVQEILSNVRWNYGPHTDIAEIPADPTG